MAIATETAPLPAATQRPRRRRHHYGRWVAVVLAATAIGGLAWRSYQVRYKNFAVYDPGKMLRSAWLESDVMAQLVKEHKVRTVINLCDDSEKLPNHKIDGERRAVERAGARLIEVVFPANATSTTDDLAYRQYESILDDPNAYPVWVHCWHGRERTAKALAIYDIRHRHMTADESLEASALWSNEHPQAIIDFAHKYQTEQPSD